MAEQSQADRKSQLVAQLERSRTDLAKGLRGLKQDVNVGAHLKHAFVRQKTAWLVGAAVTGWVLTRLPRRRKTHGHNGNHAPETKAGRSKIKDTEKGGMLLALLSLLGTLLRPALMAFATRKIADFANKNNGTPAHAKARY